MGDNSRIYTKINEINGKIITCKSAKREVQAVKNNCTNKRSDWQTSYKGLANNQELSSVKKTNVFEGEMADGLKAKVADAMIQISSGISKAEMLESSLASQIAKLESKIEELEAEKQSLYRQLD